MSFFRSSNRLAAQFKLRCLLGQDFNNAINSSFLKSKTFSRGFVSLVKEMDQKTNSVSQNENLTTPTVQDQIDDYSKYILNTYSRPSTFIEQGKGCYVYDSNGKEYLDATGGIAVLALGHSNEGVARVISEQSRKLCHTSNLYFTKEVGELAKDIVEKTLLHYPQGTKGIYDKSPDSAPQVFFTNSGTESTEAAIKFARKYGKQLAESGKLAVGKSDPMLASDPNLKYHLHCFTGGFHGRSTGALALTANPKYQTPFTPLLPGVTTSKFNETREIDSFINERTCGVILEPIQGEGGITEATYEFLKAVRKRCDQVGAVLIYDEIQCGLGRTGKLWAHSNYPPDCSPDIVTMAKPLANGFPMGATMVSKQVAQCIGAGDHGTTFGGNPLGCAIGKFVFDQISDPQFLKNVSDNGAYFKNQLEKVVEPYTANGSASPVIEVRGRGLILGVEFKENPSSIVKEAMDNGLLLVSAGRNTVRFLPPLIITKDEIDICINLFSKTLAKVLPA
ncbi:Acetylornithine aminotransferase, mitochondrial [Smittium mucronatum]|uniref:acetylornithine transaminase n=1 Tax=Smittium mucronatum TaxID=133383 RepID=A0A1R0GT49_9FUNG|nr:Acetylornithine aminotransferase, mitochondrial [Smittium mucronatum]